MNIRWQNKFFHDLRLTETVSNHILLSTLPEGKFILLNASNISGGARMSYKNLYL